ncbi:MAG: alpha/beta hydrolase [Allosphingosinicella sp.]
MALAFLTLLAALAAAALPAPEEIQAPGPQGPLAGTLQRAVDPKAPAMLIIPGSGPTDRDGNNPLGVRAAPYRMLAQDLAARGVSTVRIDKRGMFGSRAALADANAVTIGDYAADVHAWVAAVRARTGARCVWIAGHSEGGLVALAASARPEGICGLVLIAAAGRPLDAVVREQLRANPANGPLVAEADAALDKLKAGQRVDTAAMSPALLGLVAPPVQGFLIDLFSYDPAALAGAFRGPLLIVQGEADLQVSVADARRLAAAQPKAKLALIPGMNHVLKAVPADDRAANLAAYANPDLPLAVPLADTIAAFVRAAK